MDETWLDAWVGTVLALQYNRLLIGLLFLLMSLTRGDKTRDAERGQLGLKDKGMANHVGVWWGTLEMTASHVIIYFCLLEDGSRRK